MTTNEKSNAWIGVDLDGTLAYYDGWRGDDHIGEPIPQMVQRVKDWLRQGRTVKIFTARIHDEYVHNLSLQDYEAAKHSTKIETIIRAWCKEHIGQELEVVCAKDYAMVELWDDRAVRVMKNTGLPA